MLLLSLAIAAPPADVPIHDTALWERRVEQALAGPAGCWLFTGNSRSRATYTEAINLWGRSGEGSLTSIGQWTGRLEDGTWTELSYTLVRGEAGDDENLIPVKPLLGNADSEIVRVNGEPWLSEGSKRRREKRRAKRAQQRPEDQRGSPTQAVSFLQELTQGLDTSTAVSTSDWRVSLDAVQLDQTVPLEQGDDPPVVQITSVFPQGQPAPTRISARFPERLTVGSFPAQATVIDAQLHIIQQQVRDRVLPIAEASSAVAHVAGLSIGFDQRLDYTSARPCP